MYPVLILTVILGSMTGAPKIRTVKILEDLELKPRGPYSGILGFFSYLAPSVEMSVIIRTAIIDKQDEECQYKVLVGAGGAITILSDPSEEFDEMVLKANSVLSSFM